MSAMKKIPIASVALPLALAASLLAGGCSKQAPQQAQNNPPQTQAQPPAPPQDGQQAQVAPNAAGQQAMNPNAAPVQQAPGQQATSGYAPQPGSASDNAAGPAPQREPASYTIPVGTHIRIRTREELSSKTSQSGQNFSATVVSPIVVRGRTLVRSGSSASGTVVAAKAQGRFKGSGELDLRLDSITSGGQTYQVNTSSIEQVQKGKGKRTAGFALGGGGGGALIGGLAGGGKGALLGGLLGAGGGTAVNAFTGNKQVVVPAETTLTFRLEHSVTVGR